MDPKSDLLTAKELAQQIRKHVTYVYAMRRLGFPMPGRVATLSAALRFLQKHPAPRGRIFLVRPPP
jgi:hypothetical protein